MKWVEIKLLTSSMAVEAASNIFIEAGASGVSIEDKMDLENVPDDGFGQIWVVDSSTYADEGVIIKAYFPETIFLPEMLPTIEHKISELATFGLDIGKNEITISEVSESSWATAWKKYYHPIKVSRFLTIVPSWEAYTKQYEDERILTLDPGMAFGTGTHPTTRLSLQALEMILTGGETVIDVGTGSGILSIASKALNAGEVYAYDLDEVAVKSAKENMNLNEVAQDVKVQANDLLNGIDLEADVVVANILAEIIMKLIADAWRVIKPNGYFIISGIILDKKEAILSALVAQGFKIDQVHQMDDWIAIIAKKVMEE